MPRLVNTYRYRNIYFNIYFKVVFIIEWDPGWLVFLVTRRRSDYQGIVVRYPVLQLVLGG